MSLKLKHPFTKLISGPTGCGKTYYVSQLLQNLDIIDYPPEEIVFCFSLWQNRYDTLQQFDKRIDFIEGLPTLEQLSSKRRKLLIIDDLMNETDERITNIFTKGSHHMNLSVIYIVQNLFSKNKQHRTITLNTHYMTIFKNPRDLSQICRLASQMFPKNSHYLLDAYKLATSEPYSYLFIDLTQDTLDHLRLRSNILNKEFQTVYITK